MTTGEDVRLRAGSENRGRRVLEAMRSAPRYTDAIYRLVRSAIPSAPGAILDFGAGDGALAQRFLRDGITVECVEPDAGNQQALRALGAPVVADLAKLASERFGFVYTVNVLEHIAELDRDLAEIHRVLRPGGRLLVFVPAFEMLWTSLDDEVGHVRRFTRASLTRFLAAAGFALESCRYFDSIGFAAALMVRALEGLGQFQYTSRTIGFYDRAVVPLSLLADRALRSLIGKNLVALARKI